jgi:uncharacterized protein with HEPN domain
MRREALKHLADVADAGNSILRYIEGKTFGDYLGDSLLRSGVQWQFAVIGEALTRLRRDDPAALAEITAAQRIIAFRNVLVHGYDSIRYENVWGLLDVDLPRLLGEVDSLIQRGEDPPTPTTQS